MSHSTLLFHTDDHSKINVYEPEITERYLRIVSSFKCLTLTEESTTAKKFVFGKNSKILSFWKLP